MVLTNGIHTRFSIVNVSFAKYQRISYMCHCLDSVTVDIISIPSNEMRELYLSNQSVGRSVAQSVGRSVGRSVGDPLEM